MKNIGYTIKTLPTYHDKLPENPDYQRRVLVQDIWEVTRIFQGEMNYVSFLEFPGNNKILGNHYHERILEYIYIIKGKLKLYIRKHDQAEEQVKEELLEAGHLLCIQPGWSHAYQTIEDGSLIEFCMINGDPSVQDVIKDEVVSKVPETQQ